MTLSRKGIAMVAALVLFIVAAGVFAVLHYRGLAQARTFDHTPSAAENVTVLAQRFTIPVLGRPRTLRIYLPPDYQRSQRRYAVVYMHDGQNLFDRATAPTGEWGVDETLNELARTRGLELIVVGIDHGGMRGRMNELNPFDNPHFGSAEGEAYLAFIVDVVKPWADMTYRTLADRDHTAIVGSSMGGLLSHYALHRYPQVFSKAGVLSPAYWTAPAIYQYVAAHPLPADARVFLYAGGREGRTYLPDAQRMFEQLKASPIGANATMHTDPQGIHLESAWQAVFGAAILALFAPPSS